MSQTRDPQSFAADALVTHWDLFSLIYAFPPLQLLPSLALNKDVGIPVIQITTAWLRMRYANIVNLLADEPWALSDLLNLLLNGPIFYTVLWSLG